MLSFVSLYFQNSILFSH